MEVAIVSLNQINFGNRHRQDYGDIARLAEKIKAVGIIQPLAVKRTGENSYDLVAGGRRYIACEKAGITEVPVRIYSESLDEHEFRIIELMENLERKNFTFDEEISAKREIHELHVKKFGSGVAGVKSDGWTIEKTADLFGESKETTRLDIRLAESMEKIPELKVCTNKSEAQKLLDRMKEDAIRDELLRRRALKLKQELPQDAEEVPNSYLLRPDEERSFELEQRATYLKLSKAYRIQDFFVGVKSIADSSIHIIELDPPYGVDFAKGKASALRSTDKLSSTIVADANEYVEIPDKEYDEFILNVLKECFRVLRPDGWLICWFANRRYTLLSKTLEKVGFKFDRIPAIWQKINSQGFAGDQAVSLGSAYESFFYARKDTSTIRKQGRSNVFSYKLVPTEKKIHPAERPIPMIMEILSTFGDVGSSVFVPFLGSGNTIIAANQVGMDAFGFDLSERYKKSYEERIQFLFSGGNNDEDSSST